MDQETSSPEAPQPKTANRFLSLLVLALISAIIGGVIASFLVPYFFGLNPLDLLSGRYSISEEGGKEKTSIKITPKVSRDTDAVIAVAQKVKPSVVNIRTHSQVGGTFHSELEESGMGSGVIFRSDGYILTNNHVIEGADVIFVAIGNEPDVRGRVVGRDPETDLAVVKINKKDLPAAELGSSSDLRVGELVVAIGSPFGFEHTVTVGVVSALNRNVTIPGEDQVQTYTDLIQTDAAINPGNSGGALTNASGQVIGVPSLIFSASGGSQGVGFAIPINLAKDVAEQLIKTGEAVHPYIGIVGTTVDKDVAKQFNLSVEEGAMINRIASNTPADKAGMKAGDVVTTFDGKPIKTMDDLIAAIRAKKVDDKVKLTFVRGKDKKEVELTLAEKPRVLAP